MDSTTIVYDADNIRVLDVKRPDGEIRRELYVVGPNSLRLQGSIKLSDPEWHIWDFSKHLTYGALCVPGGMRSALFFGLGAGIAIRAVRELFPTASIHVVDINKSMFNVADSFFFSLNAENVNLFHADARDFIAAPPATYDYICTDFLDESLLSDTFLRGVKNALTSRGVFQLHFSDEVLALHKRAAEAFLQLFKCCMSLKGTDIWLIGSDAHLRPQADRESLDRLLRTNVDVETISKNALLLHSFGAEAADSGGHYAATAAISSR